MPAIDGTSWFTFRADSHLYPAAAQRRLTRERSELPRLRAAAANLLLLTPSSFMFLRRARWKQTGPSLRIGKHIRIKRVEGGVPSIVAPTAFDATKGLGYMHVIDRGCQMEVSRLMALGRSSQYLAADPMLVKMDSFVRQMGIYRDPRRDITPLSERTQKFLRAYVEGINLGWRSRGIPATFRVARYRPLPWTEADVVRVLRFMAFFGLVSMQISLERGLLELIRRGVPVGHLKDIFGSHLDGVDVALLRSVRYRDRDRGELQFGDPGVAAVAQHASNAWAITSARTGAKNAIIAGDPHTDVSRLPAMWYEAELHTPDNTVAGATAPGLPVVLFGRNLELGWSITYAAGDSVDYFVEECRDGERRAGKKWVPFKQRQEEVPVRGSDPRRFTVYTSDNGVLLGDPTVAGRYLSLRWTGDPGRFASTIESFVELQRTRTVDDAVGVVKGVHFPSLGWVLADSQGNVASQLSGLYPKRRKGWTGLYPVAGWEKKNEWRGMVDSETLPGEINPERGFVVCANQPWNPEGGPFVVSAPLSSYRFDRINQQLGSRGPWSVSDVQRLQYDLVSPQARRFVPLFLEYVSDQEIKRELQNWICNFPPESRRAALFQNIYRAALLVTFGDGGIGRHLLAYLLDETTFYLTVVDGLDRVLLDRNSVWFKGRDYNACMEQAVREGIRAKRGLWGDRNNVTHRNQLLSKLFGWAPRVNKGPFGMPGHHSTIHQGVPLQDQGIDVMFGPSYHFVTDMGTNTLWSNIPGGPSESPFSRLYASDLGRWRFGDYKRLRLRTRGFEPHPRG